MKNQRLRIPIMKKEQINVHLQEEKKLAKKKEFLMNISPILKIVE